MKSEEWDNLHGRYYFHRLFNNSDRTFANRYVEIWNQSKDKVFGELLSYLNDYMESDLRKAVDASILLNNNRWARYMYTLPLSSEFIGKAQDYFVNRKVWLDDAIRSLYTSTIASSRESSASNEPYYTLQGLRVLYLKRGIFIKGGKKIMVR